MTGNILGIFSDLYLLEERQYCPSLYKRQKPERHQKLGLRIYKRVPRYYVSVSLVLLSSLNESLGGGAPPSPSAGAVLPVHRLAAPPNVRRPYAGTGSLAACGNYLRRPRQLVRSERTQKHATRGLPCDCHKKDERESLGSGRASRSKRTLRRHPRTDCREPLLMPLARASTAREAGGSLARPRRPRNAAPRLLFLQIASGRHTLRRSIPATTSRVQEKQRRSS